MKKIDIVISESYKNEYYILLEDRERLEFPTKRKAIFFKREYSKYLQDNLLSLLTTYRQSYSLFIDYFVQFDSKQTNKLLNLNRPIIKKIDLLYSGFSDGWKSIAFEMIEDVYVRLNDFILSIKNYAQRYKIAFLIHQCNSLLLTYWNNFNAHRKTQNSLLVDLNYRKSKILNIVYKKSHYLKEHVM